MLEHHGDAVGRAGDRFAHQELPVLISVRPAMQRRNVVLPQPLGPTMHRISSRFTASDSCRNATTVPSRNSLDALSATMTGLSAFTLIL